jgi:S1-C subfamily serine protease
MLVGFLGIGIASRLHSHPARPTLSAATAPAVAPTTPVVPTDPTSPTAGGGSNAPSPGTASAAPQTSAITAAVDPGIVDINTVLGYQGGAGAGTGMILTPTGEILTNNHVVDGATSISVTLVSTGRTYKASVVGTDPTEDIAVLQLTGASGLTTIPLGNSSTVAVGDAVVALGNAGGAGGTPAVVTGTVQAVNQTITASDPGGANAETLNGLIQTDAPIQPGDSGGPLVNSAGKVIGIDTAASSGRRFSAGASVGFAIPINQALSIAQQIESGPASATIHLGLPGFIGVAIQPANQGGFGNGSSAATGGAVIAGVEPGSPAATIGLTAGDTITSINGQAVDSADTLSTLTRSHRPGERIKLGWTDQAGTSHTATVTLATGPAD